MSSDFPESMKLTNIALTLLLLALLSKYLHIKLHFIRFTLDIVLAENDGLTCSSQALDSVSILFLNILLW